MNRFERSWELCKSSFRLLGQHTAILTLVISLFFFIPPSFYPTEHGITSPQHWQELAQVFLQPKTLNNPGQEDQYMVNTGQASVTLPHHHGRNVQYTLSYVAWAYLAVVYLASMFWATFFNVAFYHEIMAAFRGDSVSLGRGLSFAATRWRAILGWSLLAGVVGLLIRALEQRLDFVGRWMVSLIGVAWSVASVFAIPVLVEETPTENPITVLRRSAQVLRQTWGESLIGYVGASLGEGVLIFGVLLVSLPFGVYAALNGHPEVLFVGMMGWILFTVCVSYIVGVAKQLFRGALYLYATKGEMVEPYTQEMFDGAWKLKK
jgi:hypothetical protein